MARPRRVSIVTIDEEHGVGGGADTTSADPIIQWSQLDHGRQWSADLPLLEALGFQFEVRLGEGAFGEVWRVRRGDRKMAAKILHIRSFRPLDTRTTLASTVAEMLREVEVVRRLRHPNLVAVETVAHVSDPRTGFRTLFAALLMELMDGSLTDRMTGSGPDGYLDETQAWYWFAQIMSGLSYLHGQNPVGYVCHLDIKPENILFATESAHQYVYKLSDFGTARVFTDGNPVVQHPPAGGDPLYAAPELTPDAHTGPVSLDRCDVYSLGLTLAVSLIGMENLSPWLSDTNPRQDPQRLVTDRLVNRGRFPAAHPLVRLLYGMCADDPNQRMTTAQVLDWLHQQWVLTYMDMNYVHNYY